MVLSKGRCMSRKKNEIKVEVKAKQHEYFIPESGCLGSGRDKPLVCLWLDQSKIVKLAFLSTDAFVCPDADRPLIPVHRRFQRPQHCTANPVQPLDDQPSVNMGCGLIMAAIFE